MKFPRLHKSTIAVALITAAVAVLVEVPGRVVSGTLSFKSETNDIEHGWPWVYLRREVRLAGSDFDVPSARLQRLRFQGFMPPEFETLDLPMGGVPWLRAANWRFWQCVDDGRSLHREFIGGRLLADIAIVLAAVFATICAWEFRRRRRPRIFNFGIIEMLVVVAVVSGALGWLAYMKNEHARELQLAEELKSGKFQPFENACIAPLWFRSLFSDRLIPGYFWRVNELYIAGDSDFNVEACASYIAQFKYVNRAYIDRDAFGLFPMLARFKRIDTLTLSRRRTLELQLPIDEIAQLTHLRVIIVAHDPLSREHCESLAAALPNCKIKDESDW
jgi:hypothetical protein